MRTRDLTLRISADSTRPLYVRIGEAIIQAIQSGRLGPGDPVPGTRSLAEALVINRNTIIEAVDALTAEGWLVKEPNRGTFVALSLPEAPSGRPAPSGPPASPNAAGFDLPSRLNPLSSIAEDLLDLSDGMAAHDLFPSQRLAQAYQRGIQRPGGRLLDQGSPMGHPLLRRVLADWFHIRRGFKVDPDQILVTRGTRASLTLACAFLKAGDTVAVENPGNRQAWETLLQVPGVRLVPVPVDAEGLDTQALEELLETRTIRMIYVTPQRQVPSNAVLPPARREALLQLAAKHRIIVVEDDANAEYVYDTPLSPPLAAQDSSGQVLFIASLARLTAPGIRLGVLVGPQEVVQRLARVQGTSERHGDPGLEWAFADLIRDGELDSHLRRARVTFRQRRDYLLDQLATRFQGRLRAQPTTGGLSIWVESLSNDPERLMIQGRTHGLLLRPPSFFHLEQPGPFFRLGFSQITPDAMRAALDRLDRAWC